MRSVSKARATDAHGGIGGEQAVNGRRLACPVCEYPNAQPHYRMKDRFLKVSEDDFLLYRCGSCGLLFQNEAEIGDRISEFYPSGYWWRQVPNTLGWERRYREWVVRRDQLRFLRTIFPEPQSCRLLDIGCGSGTFVKLACEVGFDAFGLENSEEAVKIGESDLAGRIFSGSGSDLIAKGEGFNILTLFHSLEHMPSPFRYLKQLRQLLREPGSLVVQVPNITSWQARAFGHRWYGLDCPRHLYNYTPFSLLYLLGRAGYRIHRLRHFSLRDNAAALVSSLFPGLDPVSQRVQMLRDEGRLNSWKLLLKEGVYFELLILAQLFAFIEAAFGRGATLTVYATLD